MADHQNEHQNQGTDYTAPSPEGMQRQVPQELAGLRLDQALARMFPEHSRSRLAAWLRDGHVLIDSAAGSPKQKIWGGERIAVTEPPSPEGTAQAEDIALNVVHEDESVLVIDKPAGLVVHPGAGNASGTLMNALLHRAPELAGVPRAGIVHRLDKDTSGLLVVARTLEAQTDLVRQMQARSVKREYLALVHGWVHGDGLVNAPLGRDPRNRVRMSVNTLGGGKEARTRYRVIERYAGATLLECSLETGRTHQIRVHMQSLGHPLVGDPVYRSGRPSVRAADDAIGRFQRQALHAARLAFFHPESEELLQFESPLPEDLAGLLAVLKESA
jgi:23S rRNA pseudouridine1911/1915/1917 synthase